MLNQRERGMIDNDTFILELQNEESEKMKSKRGDE